jgi:xylan 1,4-beta-xylosidase
VGIVENPVIRGFAPDPCACVGHDGAWYIAVSTFEWYPGVHVYRSTDLAEWKLVAAPLDRPSLLDLRGEPPSAGVWAPALSWADGKYWLCYTDTKSWHGEPRIGSPMRDQYNYLTTAERVDGEWSEPVFLTGGGYDPSLFHDEDGRKYFAYARRDYRFPGERLFEGIMLQEYSAAESKLVGEARAIYRGADLPIDFFLKQQIYEGPYIHKRGRYYYLITAEGGVGSTHATCVSRSESVWGPYEPHPERMPFLTASGSTARLRRAGHGNIFAGPGGRDYVTFLCARPVAGPEGSDLGAKELSPLGRETGIAPIEWKDDWPYLAGESALSSFPPERFEVPGPAATRPAAAERIDFGRLTRLPLELQALRVPFDASWCSPCADRPGFLRLYGRDSPASRFDQSLVARRIRHLGFEAETELEFDPACHMQFAGLILRYDESSFYYLNVTRDDESGDLVLAYMETLAGAFAYSGRVAVLGKGPVRLRATSRAGELSFAFSQGGAPFADCGLAKDLRLLADETAYPIGFTGAFVGIAASDLLGRRTPADFSYLDYRPLG